MWRASDHVSGRLLKMATEQPSVLVLTLYSGEAEYQRSCASLASQSFAAWEHRVFEHLTNAEAHARLYETVMTESGKFRLFLKLDADMVLADDKVLADLVQVFDQRPALDHLVVAVTDWMTDSRIIGAHLFSNRVTWRRHAETLYVDPDPEFPGDKLMVEAPPRDLIHHADDPSAFQAFHFGGHRALQACQTYRGLRDARPHNALVQWQYLDQVWRHFDRTDDRRLGLAILAADMVFRRELPATVNEYSDPALRAAFESADELDVREIRERLGARWGTDDDRRRTWSRALGPAKRCLVAARRVRDAGATVVKTVLRRTPNPVTIGDRSGRAASLASSGRLTPKSGIDGSFE